jgi:monofunctional biosynthetic peptidoglycan transglycosylase
VAKKKGSALSVLPVLLAVAGACALYVLWLPDVTPLRRGPVKTTAYIELRRAEAARAGKKLTVRMVWAPYDSISDDLKHAVVTAEDDMFWRHQGIDWEATRAAFSKDWQAKRMKYGASTITQQLARNLYLSPSKNPLRKIKEMLIARRLEKTLGKRRILELYLNVVEWGKGVYGAEAAAQAYFGKHASELSPDEAVAMAVVLPNPRRWNPAKGGKYVQRNSQRVIKRMVKSGYLPDPESAEAGPPPLDGLVTEGR